MKIIFIASLFTLCLMAADTKTKLSSEDQLKLTKAQLKYSIAANAEHDAYNVLTTKQADTKREQTLMQSAIDEVKKSRKCDYFEMQGEDIMCVVKEVAKPSEPKKEEKK